MSLRPANLFAATALACVACISGCMAIRDGARVSSGQSPGSSGDPSWVLSLKQAKAGDHIQLPEGVLSGSFALSAKGTEAQPIVISGSGDKTSVQGDFAPRAGTGDPKTDKPFLFLKDAEWVTIENFSVKGLWPIVIMLQNSRHITIRGLHVEGAQAVVSAVGPKTHHLLLENNVWTQDTSGDLWTKIAWDDAHGYEVKVAGKKTMQGTHRYFNGGFLVCYMIRGDVVFRRNEIHEAFNGLHCENEGGPSDKINVNFDISENLFHHVRDNPVEPEGSAVNWWIHHNEIREAHAWFSFDGVLTDRVYLFGNIGRQTEAYGMPGDHNSGKILKFDDTPVVPTGAFYIFHNSFYTSQDLVSSEGHSKDFHVWNNAIYFSGSGVPFPIGASWQADYLFDHNVLNKALPAAAHSQEVVADPGFEDGAKGLFSIGQRSAAVDAGRAFEMLGVKSQFDGKAPDAGAFEGMRRYIGPVYQRLDLGDSDKWPN